MSAIAILISPTGEEFYDAYGPMTKNRDLATEFVSPEVARRAALNRFGRGTEGFWRSEREHFSKARQEYRDWTFRVETPSGEVVEDPQAALRSEPVRSPADLSNAMLGYPKTKSAKKESAMPTARALLSKIMEDEGFDPERYGAEQATGVRQHPAGIGQFYADDGREITPQEAYDIVREGAGAVEVPNAGAGSYRAVFQAMGFTDVEDWETGSSAGDWTLIVHDGEGGFWYPAFQENRYPRHGFRYSINVEMGAPTKEELFEILQSGE
jgi:hypothetical protein